MRSAMLLGVICISCWVSAATSEETVVVQEATPVPAEDAQKAPEAPEVSEAPEAPEAVVEAPVEAAVIRVGEEGDVVALPERITLEQAQIIALRQNPNLEVAAAVVAQAGEKVKQVRSMYLPQLAAEYRQTYTWLADNQVEEVNDYFEAVEDFLDSYSDTLPDIPSLTNQTMTLDTLSSAYDVMMGRRSARQLKNYLDDWRDTINNRMDGSQLTVTAGWLLFDGFAREFSMAMARFGKRETEAAGLEAQRLILAAVAQAYYGVQLAREAVSITEANLDFTERLVKEAERRYEFGKGSRSDMLNFRVRRFKARASNLDMQGDLEAARVGLAVLMDLPGAVLPPEVQVDFLTTEKPEDMQEPDEDRLIAYALDHRPELIQSGYGLKRAEATVKQKKAAYAPQVGLFAQVDGSKLRHSSLEGDDFTSTVGFNVSYDIFTGGRRQAQIVEAKHQRREAQYRLETKEAEITGELRRICIELGRSQQLLILERAATADVEENRNLEEKAYKAGKGALLRLTLAQRDLVEAQARLALARVSLMQNWYELRSATGEILAAYNLNMETQ